MSIDIKFIDLDTNSEIVNVLDIGINNSISVDMEVNVTESGDYSGHMYLNDSPIGEFGRSSSVEFVDWYAGNGVPIYVKNGDRLSAELTFSTG